MEPIKHFFNSIFIPILYQPLFNALIFLAWLIPGHSIGWAIIVLTIIIRLILLPSNNKIFEQQRRMRALQPKMSELKEKHGSDRASHSKAVMELYATEKVSPLGGCLPSLVQLPVLFVLYRVFVNGLSTSQFDLLYPFTPHLSTINTMWLGFDLTKPDLWVLPILAGIAQFFQARQQMMMTPSSSLAGNGKSEDVGQMMSKQMMYLFPLMTVFIARTLPAALAVYWIVFGLFSVVHYTWYFRNANNLPLPPPSLKKKGGVTVSVRKKGSD